MAALAAQAVPSAHLRRAAFLVFGAGATVSSLACGSSGEDDDGHEKKPDAAWTADAGDASTQHASDAGRDAGSHVAIDAAIGRVDGGANSGSRDAAAEPLDSGSRVPARDAGLDSAQPDADDYGGAFPIYALAPRAPSGQDTRTAAENLGVPDNHGRGPTSDTT